MKTLVAAVCALVLAVPAAAQTPDAAGQWNATFYTENGPLPATIVLKKTGDKLVGTISSEMGETELSGSQKGSDVSLALTADFGNGPITITLSATIKEDVMAGVADIGGQMQLDWGAKRAVEAAEAAEAADKPEAPAGKALDVTGTWQLEVATPGGSGSPTITLEQKGEALSGRYSGQLGEASLTGTLKGNAITFQFPVDFQGSSFTVVYAGTVEQDTMKGTIRLGDMEGTFTGARKK